MKQQWILSLFLFTMYLLANWIFKQTIDYTANFKGKYRILENSYINFSPFQVTSGSLMYIEKGLAKTNQGEADKLKDIFPVKISKETNWGKYPQNIFRVITKKKYKKPKISIDFKLNAINKGGNNTSGFYIMNEYIDQNNLIYTGIRHSGEVSIKIKSKGKYTTLLKQKHSNKLKLDNYYYTSHTSSIKEDYYQGIFKIEDKEYKYKIECKKYPKICSANSKFLGIRSDFADTEMRNLEVKDKE